MEANPSSAAKSYNEGISRVRESNGKYAFLMETTGNDYINLREPCDTIRVGQPINDRGYGIATQLSSPLNYYLNLAILQIQESGEMDRIKQKWWLDGATCPTGGDKVSVTSCH